MSPVSLSNLKKMLRAGPYVWPGGYPLYFIMADGEPASFEGVKSEWKRICQAHIRQIPCDRDWLVTGYDVNWDNPDLTCAITGNPIQAAY